MIRSCFSWFNSKKQDKDISGSYSQQKQRNSQQQQQKTFDRPFHVVLIDLKKATNNKEIHCVEKPLTDDDFKYVAISYRWGEVQESTVNTGVGYLGTITSFSLNDFFGLCAMIAKEIDLQSMDYIWVDAICVNQTNLEQRKATIYHMTDIYERANYILAVPDLHLRYLRESSKNNQNSINGSSQHGDYIFHLVRGNIQKLFDYDQQWLDYSGVPKDNQRLRYLLTHYTEHFATGLATCRKINYDYHNYEQKEALQHIFETTTTTITHSPPRLPSNDDDNSSDKKQILIDKIPVDENNNLDPLTTIKKIHSCDDGKLCPFNTLFNISYYHDDDYHDKFNDQRWKHEIPERSQAIRQSVMFLRELVIDWSSRAWVVSEFHIAKNKGKKMKYWFLQLGFAFQPYKGDDNTTSSFFTFHFDDEDPPFSTCGDGYDPTIKCRATGGKDHQKDNLIQAFHTTMRRQLNEQTFFEKILKTKASRHEDRFHAILPSTEYKSMLDNKDKVDYWHNNMNTLMDVKLELFNWMNTKHKLELLFLAGTATNTCEVLPTFATTNIKWESYPTLMAMDDPTFPGNFDLTSSSTIQLIQQEDGQDIKSSLSSLSSFSSLSSLSSSYYKLNIKPKKYYRLLNTYLVDRHYKTENYIISRLLALNFIDDDDDNHHHHHYDFILIPTLSKEAMNNYNWPVLYNYWKRVLPSIALLGCMTRNRWVLTNSNYIVERGLLMSIVYKDGEENWEHCHCDESHPGFDIY